MNINDFYTTNEDGDKVLIPKGETKSLDDVIQCIEHNKGTDNRPVKLFVAMYHEGKKWEWFDRYQEYLAEKKKIEDYNAALVPDSITKKAPDQAPLPTEPSDFVAESDDDVKHQAIKVLEDKNQSSTWLLRYSYDNNNYEG